MWHMGVTRPSDAKQNDLPTHLIGWYLLLKPLIDLSWRYDLAGINLQSLLHVVLPFTALLLLLARYRLVIRFQTELLFLYWYAVAVTVYTLIDLNYVPAVIENLKFVSSFLLYLAMIASGRVWSFFIVRSRVFALSAGIVGIFGILQLIGLVEYQYFTGVVVPGELIGRLTGGYPHPVNSSSLIVFLLLLWGLPPNEMTERSRRWLLGALLLLLPTVIFSYHRVLWITGSFLLLIILLHRGAYKLLLLLLTMATIVAVPYREELWRLVWASRFQPGESVFDSRLSFLAVSVQNFYQAPFWNKVAGATAFSGGRVFGDSDYGRILYLNGALAFVLFLFHLLWTGIASRTYRCAMARGRATAAVSLLALFAIVNDPTRYPMFLSYYMLIYAGLVHEKKRRLPFLPRLSAHEGASQ